MFVLIKIMRFMKYLNRIVLLYGLFQEKETDFKI